MALIRILVACCDDGRDGLFENVGGPVDEFLHRLAA